MADGIHRGTFRATPIFNHFQTNDGSMLSCSRVGIPSNPSAVNAVYNQSTWAVLKFSGVYAEACLVNTSDDHSIIVSDDLVHPACHKKATGKAKVSDDEMFVNLFFTGFHFEHREAVQVST